MSLSVLNKHKNASLAFAIVAIILVIGFNLYMYVIGPSMESNSAPPQPAADGSTGGVDESVVQQANAANREFSWLPIIISGIALIVVAGGAYAGFVWVDQQRQKRDQRRRTDLQTLANALVAYKQANGHYPISASYQPEYYTGINLSNDWHYYGLPTDDQMRQFLPSWPISDPSISYTGHDQTNQYIYYPRNNGQEFDLYAHLEAGSGQLPNYNQQDGLLQAWGQYNFKISSQTLGQTASPPQSTPAASASAPAQPTANTPAPTENPATPATPQPAAAAPPPANMPINLPPSAEPAALAAPSAIPTPQPAPIIPPAATTAPLSPATVATTITLPQDTSVQPQVVVTAAQAGLQEAVYEQQEMSQINQLLQDVDSSILLSQTGPRMAQIAVLDTAPVTQTVAPPNTVVSPSSPNQPLPANGSSPTSVLPDQPAIASDAANQPTLDQPSSTPNPPPTLAAAQSSGPSTLAQLDRLSQAIAIQFQKATPDQPISAPVAPAAQPAAVSDPTIPTS